MWHKPCRTLNPWCLCIKTRCLFCTFLWSTVFDGKSLPANQLLWERSQHIVCKIDDFTNITTENTLIYVFLRKLQMFVSTFKWYHTCKFNPHGTDESDDIFKKRYLYFDGNFSRYCYKGTIYNRSAQGIVDTLWHSDAIRPYRSGSTWHR